MADRPTWGGLAGTKWRLHPLTFNIKTNWKNMDTKPLETQLACCDVVALDRRRFIKVVLLGSAVSALPDGTWMATLAGNVQPSQQGTGILRVNVTDFPALQNVNGSVRLGINRFTDNGPNGPFYPVLVNRGTGDQYFALSARCTHQNCVVPTFGRTCPCHGSRFGIDGRVITGPAFGPLTRYPATLEGNMLRIEIPGLGYSATGSLVAPGTSPRFRLTFNTFPNTEYEVRFGDSVSAVGRVVPFSLTEDGSIGVTSLNADGKPATVFLNRESETGFYTVSIKLRVG